MREQHYQTIMTNIANGRVKPTQPPTIPQDYYGTITNRLSTGKKIYLILLCNLHERFDKNHALREYIFRNMNS